jgi:hypothetical protein
MAKKKVVEDVIETPDTKVEAVKELSKAQLEFVAMMENYRKTNPAKYAQKEEAFIKKLNSL